jgi:hypothetical protein
VKETAASVRKDIQHPLRYDTGKYKKSWSVKNVREDSESIDLVVHSRNRYQIAHLWNTGTPSAEAAESRQEPHIASAEQRGNEKLSRPSSRNLEAGS